MTYGQGFDRTRNRSAGRKAPSGDRAFRRDPGAGAEAALEDQPPGPPGLPRRRRHMPLWQELPLLLVVAFCLAVLIRTFLLQAFFIPSSSMTDTLLIGDRVLVNKVVYDVRDPRRGEVVVFRGTDRWAPEQGTEAGPKGFFGKLGATIGDLVGVSRPGEKDFIKRIVGLPGDRVACCDAQGRVTVNGYPLDEPYVIENSPLEPPPSSSECRSRRFNEVVVPAGQVFVMGDHRLVSMDSRCQGPVPMDNIIGRAFIVVWPQSHWDNLPIPDTFKNVPDPANAGQAPPPGVPPAPGSEQAAGGPATTPPPATPTGSGGIVLILPILWSFSSAARSGLRRGSGPRRLAA